MLWKYPQDFEGTLIDLTGKFESQLPGKELLRDSVLDPALSIANWRGSPVLDALSINAFAVDTLKLQQFMLGWSGENLGVLSEYAPYFAPVLDVFSLPMTTSLGDMIESVVLTAIGTTGQVLSAVPNPYAKIIGAVLGIGVSIYEIFDKDPKSLPAFTIPAQAYDEDTDQDQFNGKVRAVLRLGESFQKGGASQARLAFDYTPFFMPRFAGDPTLEYRDQGGRVGVAFGMGIGGLHESPANDERSRFIASGPSDLGYVPGGVRITSVIQVFPTEDPSQSQAPWYDPRCGSAFSKAMATDVGSFYTSTNQGIQLLWDLAMKNSPQMFTIDTERLKSAWNDYIEAALDGVVWLWNHKVRNDWGKGTWHAMIAHISSAFTVGINGQSVPGAIGTLSPDLTNCGSLNRQNDPLFFELWDQVNLYDALIKPACNALADRQRHYLKESLISAYLPRPVGSYVSGTINGERPENLAAFLQARTAILNGPGKGALNLDDVVDLEYRAQIEAKLPQIGGPGYIKMAEPGPPGPGRPSDRLVVPPFPPQGDPPFTPGPPIPGRPGWTRSQKLAVGAVAAGTLVGAAGLAYRKWGPGYTRRPA